MNRKTWKAVMVLLLLTIGFPIVQAQETGAGSIQGTVTDPKGAVIPGAKIHVVKASTAETFDTTTNQVGFYSVPSLFFGDYTIDVSANGMKMWETTLTLQAGQTVEVDPHLTLGRTNSEITVVADQTTTVNTENSTQGTEIEKERIEQLPSNGRYLTQKIYLSTPGYEGTNSNMPRINGLMTGAISWTQDGMSIDYRDGGGLDNVAPDPDTVQEVKVETTNSTAASDRPGYAIISTKAGTNTFHGGAFESNQDNAYGVAHARNSSAKANKQIRNEYGANIGGPIYLPFLGEGHKTYNGKDKSFFFAAWHGMALRADGAPVKMQVPTAAMRNGDFSGLTDSNGNAFNIYDPTTSGNGSFDSKGNPTGYQRQQFDYNNTPNRIDPSRISPVAKALYAITPLPTIPNADPYVTYNWFDVYPSYQQQWDFVTRLDHHFSDSDTAFLRYSIGHRLQYNLGSSSGVPTTDLVWNNQYQPLDTQNAALSWSHISSPTFYQTVTVGMGYQSWRQQGEPSSVANANVTGQLGLPNDFGSLGLPNILGSQNNSQTAQNSLLQGYGQGSNPWRDSDYTNTFEDNLTWVHGAHQVQYGGRYRHDQLRIQPDQPKPAVVTFTDLATGLLDPTQGSSVAAVHNSGLASADFFLGYAGSYTNQLPPHYLYLREQEFSIYVQDDYHVRQNLTVNIGLRWQGMPAYHERENLFTSFDFKTGAIVTGQPVQSLAAKGYTTVPLINATQTLGAKYETPEVAGMPRGMFESYWYNFLPRVGVAWQPLGDTFGLVVRGGYGSYLYQTPARNLYGAYDEGLPYTFAYTQDYNNPNQNDGYNNAQLRLQPVAQAGVNSANVVSLNNQNAITPGSIAVTGTSPDQRPDGYREWNVAVEQNLRHHTAVSVAYVGNHGFNLDQYWYYNSAPSDYVWFMSTGQPKPQGTYANTAELSYNRQTGGNTYGQIQLLRKTGWSNANQFQASFQRLYYKGISYQVSYVYGRYYRIGGNGSRDSQVYEPQVFMPGTVPTDDWKSLDRIENYVQDTTSGNAMPHQHVKYSWVVDLPFGNGRHFLSHANRVVDGLIGGWELSGAGGMTVTLSQLSTSDWGPFGAFHFYGKSKPITDCVDKNANGKCSKAYYAYNGYVSQSQYNTPNGFQGLPGTYQDEVNGGAEHQPLNLGYGNQQLTTPITLNNGTTVSNVTYSPGPKGLNPNARKFIDNPWNFSTDATLFKAFRINERLNLKVNGDFFNLFNQMGTTGVSGGSGIITTTSNYQNPRVVQVGARLSW